MAGNGSDGKAASISGVNAAHDQSHNGMIIRFKAKGTQYCGTTAQDKNHMDNLFEVAFATRNSQSIMSGCTGYNNRFYATVVKIMWNCIIISKSDANYLVVGSTGIHWKATALSGSNRRMIEEMQDFMQKQIVSSLQKLKIMTAIIRQFM